MKVNEKHFRTIWQSDSDQECVQVIDQRFLPYQFVIEDLYTVDDMIKAISEMHVRGAGLIGASAGWGMYLAALEAKKSENFDERFLQLGAQLKASRPTAVNLAWAVDRQCHALDRQVSVEQKIKTANEIAQKITDEDAEWCRKIGEHGLELIRKISERKQGEPVNILTHCNAGWLAFVDYGSATAPIYAAHEAGINVHVWVDETRPRNQGARLTAWELSEHGVPHTVIVDNVGGHLMQHNQVDLVITGTDRTTRSGDVANKIGTYLKALAASDNNIPFYVALPSSTFDWSLTDGVSGIPIEERDQEEVRMIEGEFNGRIESVLLTPKKSQAANYAFDVTPARLVNGLITERGICEAKEEAILALFPEHR